MLLGTKSVSMHYNPKIQIDTYLSFEGQVKFHSQKTDLKPIFDFAIEHSFNIFVAAQDHCILANYALPKDRHVY